MSRSEGLLLSLDIGTTAIKVGLFSIEGNLLRLALREQTLIFPRPGRAEQDLFTTWRLVAEACHEVLANRNANSLAAVVLTSHRGSVVPIGLDAKPLTNLIVWMDQRGLGQVDRLNAVIGAETYYRTSGHPIVPITGVSKVLWIQQEAPDIWEKTVVVGAPQTLFLNWLGCEESLIDFSTGSYLFPCDIAERKWSPVLASRLAFPLDRLPRQVAATDIVGRVGREAASQLGIPQGTPIVAGGGDGQCAAAGTGVVSPGRVMVNIGTAAGVQVYLTQPTLDPGQTLNCAAHVVPGAWEMEAHTQASGTVFRWLRDQCGAREMIEALQSGREAYDLLVEQARQAPPGSDGLIFLPTFNGSTAPIVDPAARGALIGLALSHTRGHIIRSVLEGISLEIRWMLDAIASTGAPVNEIYLVGGGSKNMTWNQIHADILGHTVHLVQNPDAALVGAAMCAAVALGAYPDFGAASAAFVRTGTAITPIPQNQDTYDRCYERFVHLFTLLSQHRGFAP